MKTAAACPGSKWGTGYRVGTKKARVPVRWRQERRSSQPDNSDWWKARREVGVLRVESQCRRTEIPGWRWESYGGREGRGRAWPSYHHLTPQLTLRTFLLQ